MYIVYKCRSCGKHFVLFTNEVEHSEKESRYITCPYHGKHIDIIVCGRYDNLKECMDNHVWVREGRRMRQIK
jgi:DNA-directed RNA polymerase subunit RPC12/RpoP